MAAIDEPGEVIVVDNNSTDATAQIAEARGARVVFEPHNQIARSRNAGAAAAKGDTFVFLDADTILPPEVLRRALANIAAGDCCGGGAHVDIDAASGRCARAVMRFWNWLSVRNSWAAGWERRGWRRKTGAIKNLDLVKELYFKLQSRSELELRWIKAHDGSLWNEYADSLANAWRRSEL